MPGKNTLRGSFPQPFGSTIDRRILTGEEESVAYLPGKRYRIWHNDQNVSYNAHRHSALEIILCTGNVYTIVIGEQTFKLHEGDILFIPPDAVHQIISAEPGERFIMLFDMSILEFLDVETDVRDYYSKPHFLSMSLGTHIYPFVYSGLTNIISYYFSGEKLNEISIYTELFKLFALMCDSASRSLEAVNENHTDNYDKFVSILSYIDTNYSEDLALESVANTAGFSKFHFSRLFKQYTGTTFYDYLCSRRIMVAKSMLLKNMPVTDVAFQTGFNNLTTFCRCFKKYTGCSPTQFKNESFGDDKKIIHSGILTED